MTEHIPVILSSDFPGGNGANPVELAPDHWQVEPQGDLIYGPWYYVELENTTGQDREVRLDVTGIPDAPGIVSQADRPVYCLDEGSWFPLGSDRAEVVASARLRRYEEPIVWFWEREEPVPADRWRDFPTVEAHLRIPVPANARVRVATTYPYLNRELHALTTWLTQLPERQRRLVRVETAGLSEQGRPIVTLILTNPDIPVEQKQVVAITARHHPALEDSGSWCAEGIVEWLLSGHPRANNVLDGWTFVVFPIVNPDSVEAGRTHYNVHEVDLFMDYLDRASAEVRAVFNTLEQFRPDFFIDFHGWLLHQVGQPPYDGSYLDIVNSLPWDSAVYQAMAEAWRERIYGFASFALHRSILRSCSAGGMYWEWHTLGVVTEVNPGGHSQFQIKTRAVDNLMGAIDLFERRWPGYPIPGVPNREIAAVGDVSLFAWGDNWEVVRASRVALWRAREGISLEASDGRVTVRAEKLVGVPAAVRLPARDRQATITANGEPVSGMITTEEGWLFVPVTLDGEPVTVAIDTP
jgi:hypothetical protein